MDHFQRAERVVAEYRNWIRFDNWRVKGNEAYLADLHERTEAELMTCLGLQPTCRWTENWRFVVSNILHRQANDLLETLVKAEREDPEKQAA